MSSANKWADAAGEVVGRLRPIAEAATQDPWDWNEAGRLYGSTPGKFYSVNVLVVHDPIWRPNEHDARYIATFDPPTVLSLLDQVEAALTGWPAAESERDALAAEVVLLRGVLNEVDVIAGNTIPPDGDEAAWAALRDISNALNPARLPRAALNKDEANAK